MERGRLNGSCSRPRSRDSRFGQRGAAQPAELGASVGRGAAAWTEPCRRSEACCDKLNDSRGRDGDRCGKGRRVGDDDGGCHGGAQVRRAGRASRDRSRQRGSQRGRDRSRCRRRCHEVAARDAEAHARLVAAVAVRTGDERLRSGRLFDTRTEAYLGRGRALRQRRWRPSGVGRGEGRGGERRWRAEGGRGHTERRRRGRDARRKPLTTFLAEDEMTRIVPAARGADHAGRWDNGARSTVKPSRRPSSSDAKRRRVIWSPVQSASWASMASSSPTNWEIPAS